jgi:hypothetical protein
MTAHVPRFPFSFDPLIAEAKRRMRHRRVLVALIAALLAAAAVGGVYAVGPLGPGGPAKPPVGSAVTSSSDFARQYNSPLGWSIRLPHRMYLEHSTGGGISFGVDEATVANFRVQPGVREHLTPNGRQIFEVPPQKHLGGRFPADGIAVRVLWFQSLGPISPKGATHPPLRLSSFNRAAWRWYPDTRPRPLQEKLALNRRTYYVQVWTGPGAAARQRSLLAQIVASISARRIHKRP